MFYKNISFLPRTFYGVEFQPGETKEVSKYINSKYMIVVPEPPKSKPAKPTKPVKQNEEIIEDAPVPVQEKLDDNKSTKEEKLDGTDSN